MSTAKAKVSAFYSDAAIGLCLYRNVLILDIAGAATVAHIEAMGQAYRKLLEGTPRGVCALARLSPGVPLPTKEVRHASAQLMRTFDRELVEAAVVVEEQGTIGQLFVTALRGINMLAGVTKARPVTRLEEAAERLAPTVARLTGAPATAEELVLAARAARDAVRPTGARRAAGK